MSQVPDRFQPSFYIYPQQNNRTGWQPVWLPVVLVNPWRKFSDPGRYRENSEIKSLTFGIEDTMRAKVAGHDHVGIFNPDLTLYKIDVTEQQLRDARIDLTSATFYTAGGEQIDQSEAKEGDYFEFVIGRGITDRIIYYPDAEYHDLSMFEIDVTGLPERRYNFVWQATYCKRVSSSDGELLCISDDIGYARYQELISHPGEIHLEMVNKTPPVYFTSENRQSDPIINLYRPFADALQDIFDEQELLRGINWVHDIPPQLIPYLAYLIGIDLPFFQQANDNIRRAVVRRGAYLQKLKGTHRAIIELFEIAGFTVDLINLWSEVNGKYFIAPGEQLVDESQEIEVYDVCQVDPALVGYAESGFGNLDVPLLYRNTGDGNGVTIDAWFVEDGSDLQDALDDMMDEVNKNPDYLTDETCVRDAQGSIIPRKLLEAVQGKDGSVGYSHIFLVNGSVRVEYSTGSAPLNANGVSFDRVTNTANLIFNGHQGFDDYSAYFFISYQRDQIVLPDKLERRQSNRFDVNVEMKTGEVIDSNLYDFLINLLFGMKAFHSILRKITYTITLDTVYNVSDFCAGSEITQDPNYDAGNLQVPPAIIPTDPGDECDDIAVTRGFKPEDIAMRQAILAELEREFQVWQDTIDSHRITDSDRQDLSNISDVPTAYPDNDNDGYNNYGQDRRAFDPDYDPDDGPDTRGRVRDTDAGVDYCYKGRVQDEVDPQRVMLLDERVRCKPCSLGMGQGVYYTLDTTNAKNQGKGWLGRLQRNYGDTNLQFSNRTFFPGPISQPAILRPSLDIEKYAMHFPGHRFLTMFKILTDFTHPEYRARPWDFTEPCRCDIDTPYNPLNARIEEGTDGEEYIVWDDADLVYQGNGLVPDQTSLGDPTTIYDITHAIYTTAEERPGITLDMTVYAEEEAVNVSEPIFESASDCGVIGTDG